MCAQILALGTWTKFEDGILTINVISGIVFGEIIFESLWNVGKTTPCLLLELSAMAMARHDMISSKNNKNAC